MSTLESGTGGVEYRQKMPHEGPEVVATSLDLFPSGGDPSPIQANDHGRSVVRVEAGAHLDVSPIIQSPFSFGDSARHATADGTRPGCQPHPQPPPPRGGPLEKFRPGGGVLHTLIKRGGTLTKILPPPPGRPPSTRLAPKEAEIWATNYGRAPPCRGFGNRNPHCQATTHRGDP